MQPSTCTCTVYRYMHMYVSTLQDIPNHAAGHMCYMYSVLYIRVNRCSSIYCGKVLNLFSHHTCTHTGTWTVSFGISWVHSAVMAVGLEKYVYKHFVDFGCQPLSLVSSRP